MKKSYSVYLTEEEYCKLQTYAARAGRSFSRYMAWVALSEMNRQQTRKRRKDALCAVPTGIDNDMVDRLRYNL